MKQSIALSLVLSFLSNGLTVFVNVTGVDRQLLYVPWASLVLVVALFWARGPGKLSWVDVGLSGRQWKGSAIIGTLSGLVVAAPLLLILTSPILLAGPVQYREIQNLDVPGLLWRLGVELTLATALTEEILFRGILQALFKRSLTTTQAIVSTNVVFALWHLVINALSLQQNLLALPWFPIVVNQAIGYFGSLIAVGIGGAILSVLRERTNHLAGSVAMHWVAVAAMSLLIYRQ